MHPGKGLGVLPAATLERLARPGRVDTPLLPPRQIQTLAIALELGHGLTRVHAQQRPTGGHRLSLFDKDLGHPPAVQRLHGLHTRRRAP